MNQTHNRPRPNLRRKSPHPARPRIAGLALAALLAAVSWARAQTNEPPAALPSQALVRTGAGLTNAAPALAPGAATNAIRLTTNAPAGVENSALSRLETNAVSLVLTNADGKPAYAMFKIIPERNIFDPNRRPRRAGAPKTDAPPPVRIETFTLTGILSSDKGAYAFFDGSSSSYVKAVAEDGVIAGYKLASIDPPDRVQLEKSGKKTELQVGMRMRRQDSGPWELAGFAASDESSGSDFPRGGDSSDRPRRSRVGRQDSGGPGDFQPPAGGAGGADGASSGGESDALKRLMLKREQELKNEKP